MIQADGSPAYAMIAMLTGAVINIVLDPIFIFGFKWGIACAAWATVIGQSMSFLVCAVYFFRPKIFRLRKSSFVPNVPVLRHIIALIVIVCLTFSFFRKIKTQKTRGS